MKQSGVYDIYDGEIATMKEKGFTLREIGTRCGVSHERIRQILNDKYPNVSRKTLARNEVAQLLGVSTWVIASLVKKNMATSERTSYHHRYHFTKNDVLQIANYIANRQCIHCGKPIERLALSKYCESCSANRIRNHYPFMGSEGKRKHLNATRRWLREHPQRTKELAKKHGATYRLRQKVAYYATLPEYVVIRPNTLKIPVGTVIRAKDAVVGYVILTDNTRIPVFCVRRLKQPTTKNGRICKNG